MMPVKFVATCLTAGQMDSCQSLGVDIIGNYARSYGEIVPGCVTDFTVHCFNSAALTVLRDLGVKRATLHPELNLAQIRDIKKCIDTELVVYGKIPLMKLGNPAINGTVTDRTGTKFFIKDDNLYNSVPVFMADKMNDIEKSGVTHARFIFTTEAANEVNTVIKAYMHKKALDIEFTRGKFYKTV